MNLPDKRIVEFILRHHVLTLATSAGNRPWCASLFYAYLPSENIFVFTSGHHTKHASDALSNGIVAGSIALETKIVGKVRGLQLTGKMRPVDGNDGKAPKNAYLKRFPYAAASPLELWILEPSYIKFTDNRLGFGKKMIWEKDGRQE